MHNQLQISSGAYSIAGVKEQNEDACGILVPEEPLLTTKGITIAIADGMSGSEAGAEASQACVKGFLSDYYSSPESWTVKTSAHKILAALNHWLYGQSHREYGNDKGFVTTFSTLVIKSNTAFIFHIGDSRIYRLRNNDLECLTTDHRVRINDKKSFLSRAMGIDLRLDIDHRQLNVEKNDIFIQLTDGAFEFVNDNELKRCVTDNSNDLNQAAKVIVELASNNNSDDNITCQIAKLENLPTEDQDEFYQKLTQLPFPPPLEPGMILDGYKVIRHLFSNKRTEVYLVRDTDTDKTVVLKAPSVNYEDDAKYINQFLHEEWAGRRINNNHVLHVLEPIRKRTALYYVTEYIEGRTLEQWMKDEARPTLTQVRNMVEQIAKGLRAFHRLEMIHQDLKPGNILIDDHGTLKIIDFGSTKIAGIEEISTPVENDDVLGTVNYTAPEYHLGYQGTNRSDIYSLGVITYELLSGHLPYGKDINARNINRLQYRSVKHFNQEIPVWVDKVIEKAVAMNPDNRFKRLSELTYALSHPDPTLINLEYVPLIKRNPVRVWQAVSLLLLLSNFILLALIIK